jgi:hypothetical protein
MTRFRGLVAIGAAAGIAAGAAKIIRRQDEGKSPEPIALVVEPGSAARATNTMTNEVGHGEAADLPATGSGPQPLEPPGSLPPSEASGPLLDLSNVCKLPAAQVRETPGPSFIGYWIAVLLIVTVGCGFASWCFLKNGFVSNDNPPHATGGLLMFTAEPTSSSHFQTAAVWVDSRKSDGFPGVSILEVTLVFEHARPGLRWYIAASGQYAPKINMPIVEFCADATAVRRGSIIACRNNAGHGYRDATYNFKDHIGMLYGRQIRDLGDSLPGYIDTNTVIVSGILTNSYPIGPPGTLATHIWIPFRSPASTKIGSDTYFAYAPVAITSGGDFGQGALLGQIANPHSTALFGDSAAQMPLDYLQVSSLDLSIEAGAGKDELTRASPPTVQSDQLQWQTTGNGIGAISFTFHNPFIADQLSRDIFIAGICISIGATALLLLLEKLIERWIEWRRLRASNHHPTQSGSTGGQAGPSHLI